MVLYAVGASFIAGLLRWPLWSVPLLIVGYTVVAIGLGYGWSLDEMRPLNNPIFFNAVLTVTLAHTVACSIGYLIGRVIAFIWSRFMGRDSSAAPPAGPASRQ